VFQAAVVGSLEHARAAAGEARAKANELMRREGERHEPGGQSGHPGAARVRAVRGHVSRRAPAPRWRGWATRWRSSRCRRVSTSCRRPRSATATSRCTGAGSPIEHICALPVSNPVCQRVQAHARPLMTGSPCLISGSRNDRLLAQAGVTRRPHVPGLRAGHHASVDRDEVSLTGAAPGRDHRWARLLLAQRPRARRSPRQPSLVAA